MQGELVVLRRRLRDLRNGVHHAIDQTERARSEAFGHDVQAAQRSSARVQNRSYVHDSLDIKDSFDHLVDRAESRVEATAYTGPRDIQPRDRTRNAFDWI